MQPELCHTSSILAGDRAGDPDAHLPSRFCCPQVVSYHTHIPEYIPMYTWKGLVEPMWKIIRFNVLMADLTLVPSKTMKASKRQHVDLQRIVGSHN